MIRVIIINIIKCCIIRQALIQRHSYSATLTHQIYALCRSSGPLNYRVDTRTDGAKQTALTATIAPLRGHTSIISVGLFAYFDIGMIISKFRMTVNRSCRQ